MFTLGFGLMAALMMAPNGNSAMAEMTKANEKIPPELSIPYGFPRSGYYRIFFALQT